MHIDDIQHIRVLFLSQKSSGMHKPWANFDKIFGIAKSLFCYTLNADDNFFFNPEKPKLTDCEIFTLSIVGESIGIDSKKLPF